MPKFTFSSESMGRAMATVKTVKPIIEKFTMKVYGDKLIMYSYDKRRWSMALVDSDSSFESTNDYDSGEFYVSVERQTLINTDLDSVTLSITDKVIKLKTDGSGQTRSATLQRRNQDSKLPKIPKIPDLNGSTSINSKKFFQLLHQVSCSALVKDTKTDEARKVNQIHFYPNESCAYANARGFMSISFLSGIGLDISMVSDDVPLMKAFCLKLGDSNVLVFQDEKRIYLSDESRKNILCLSRVACKKPVLPSIDTGKFETELVANRSQFMKSMDWAKMTIDGTQRMSVRATSESGKFSLIHNKEEISNFPVTFNKGNELSADFSFKILSTVSSYLEGDEITLKFHHHDSPNLLEVSEISDSEVRSRHMLLSMAPR